MDNLYHNQFDPRQEAQSYLQSDFITLTPAFEYRLSQSMTTLLAA